MTPRTVVARRNRSPRKRRRGFLALGVQALTLPFGASRASVEAGTVSWHGMRVHDRGPSVGHRVAELSQAAAASPGLLSRGPGRARPEILSGDQGRLSK